MSVAAALSLRTQVRDIIVAALGMIDQMQTVRVKGAEIVTDYLQEGEIKKAASYGVIVTNEELSFQTQGASDVSLTVLITVYVRSEQDRRAMLDASLEDIWEVLRSGQLVKSVIPQLRLDSIETDEAATSAKPYAQAVMRWSARGLRRPVSW